MTLEPRRRWEDLQAQRKGRMRKGMYLLPSLFTAANIGAGYYAIIQTLYGGQLLGQSGVPESWHFDFAAKAIGVAVVADGLDGRIARLTNTASDFGRELDSLADVITFGVAPALLAWVWGVRMLPAFGDHDLEKALVQWGLIASFIFLVAGASRLARFNIQVNPQPSNPGRPGRKYFVGMPIPAGAGVIAAVVHFTRGQPLLYWWLAPIWLALLVMVGFLMVSTWRFPSFKDLHLSRRHPFQTLVLICGIGALIWFYSQYVLFTIAIAYMLSGVLMRFAWVLRRRPTHPSYKEAPEPR
ncbi:MAG TPA: phosphatidylcholine/phosphatidylserine synthase [Candidatus Angelobacter sp.]|nr:phosphatidylcholine/phosphatidylserine synthase [Candidatus Angelobacter sp.]